MKYLPRIADSILEKRLMYKGAVVIEGLKWCGKTSTARLQSKSELDLATVGNYAYQNKDGIWIVPITTLKN